MWGSRTRGGLRRQRGPYSAPQGWKVGVPNIISMMPACKCARLGFPFFFVPGELAGQETDFPKDCYQGDYIVDLARGNHHTCSQIWLEAGRGSQAHCQEFGMVEILGGHKERSGQIPLRASTFSRKKSGGQRAVSRLLQLSTRPGIRFTKMALIGSGPRFWR